MNKDVFFGVIVVLGGILIHFTFGHFYTIANLVPYIFSYIRATNQADISNGLSIWLSAAALGMQGVAMPLGGLAAKKIGVRPVVAISCIVNSGSVLLTYFTVQHSFAYIVLTYGLLVGFGFGFAYSVVMAAAISWFPEHRGLIGGLIVGGFGLSALVCTPIQTAYINPDNVKVNSTTRDFTDKALLGRVPNVFLLMGGILLALQIIGFILLRPKPVKKEGDVGYPDKATTKGDPDSSEALNLNPCGDEHLIGKVNAESENDKTSKLTDLNKKSAQPKDFNLSPKQMLQCLDFYLLWFIMFCHIIPINIITSAYKMFGQQYIDDDLFLSMVVTITSVFNCGGRVAWGFIVDKLSFKTPLIGMLIFWAAVLFTFPHLAQLTGTTLKVTFAIWACMLFFSLSGVFAIMPAATGSLFGSANLATNYGIVYSAFAFGSLLCALITTFVSTRDAYIVQFSCCGAVCLVALFATIWLDDRKTPVRLDCFKRLGACCPRLRRQHLQQQLSSTAAC